MFPRRSIGVNPHQASSDTQNMSTQVQNVVAVSQQMRTDQHNAFVASRLDIQSFYTYILVYVKQHRPKAQKIDYISFQNDGTMLIPYMESIQKPTPDRALYKSANIELWKAWSQSVSQLDLIGIASFNMNSNLSVFNLFSQWVTALLNLYIKEDIPIIIQRTVNLGTNILLSHEDAMASFSRHIEKIEIIFQAPISPHLTINFEDEGPAISVRLGQILQIK